MAEGQRYHCSVDLDQACRATEPQAARWDYVLGTTDSGIGMGVHPAKASEVEIVIAKKRWAQERLSARCQLHVLRWCWIRPRRSALQFTQLSPQARLLAKNGIEFPAGRLL